MLCSNSVSEYRLKKINSIKKFEGKGDQTASSIEIAVLYNAKVK